MRYLWTTELTKSIDCCQANCLTLAVSTQWVEMQLNICGPHIFNKLFFVCNSSTYMNNYIWQFPIFTGVGFTA